MLPKQPLQVLLLSASLLAAGCASTHVTLDTPRHEKIIANDQEMLQPHVQKGTQDSTKEQSPYKKITLSIENALEMAVQQNLDARISALEYLSAQGNITLEKIKALPSMEYTLTRHGRSKDSASSSLSVLTGQQSLEPSISSERHYSTRDITLNWNIIDAASALMQAKTASDQATINAERHKKVIQNIHRDVYAAYWRAQSTTNTDTTSLINAAQTHIGNIDKAAQEKLISKDSAAQQKAPYISTINALKNLQNESELALIELKSLLNLPQSTQLNLDTTPSKLSKISEELSATDIETLELTALRNRPEMREAFINKNISIRDTKQEIINTIPGADLFFAFNKDTNKFLANDSWRSYSLSLVQNITNVLSFPDRYQIARKNENLSEERRITLAAAIMAQTHIAKHGLSHHKTLYNLAAKEQKDAQYQAYSAQKKSHMGHTSKSDALLSKMQAQEKKLKAQQAYAAAQDSYAVLINTLGMNVGEAIPPAKLAMGAS